MKPNFKILDGLRGIAATYVLINHSRGNLLIGGNEYATITPIAQWSIFEKIYFSALQLTSLGREFVILFFILSGFSIAYSLQNKTSIINFYSRRLIRLYPPYILALIWAAIVFFIAIRISPGITDGKESVFTSISSTTKNLFYLPNGAFIGQFWSLTYEVIFYLVVPIFVLNKRLYYLISILIYVVSFYSSWNSTTGNNIISMFILDYNIYFAIGIYFFHNYKKINSLLSFKNNYLLCSTLGILFVSMVILKFKTTEENKISILVSVFFSIILITNFLQKEIHNKVLTFLGNMSYTLYITHVATIFFFKAIIFKMGIINSLAINAWYLWIICVFVTILISSLFYKLAENPSKILLKNIRNKKDSVAVELYPEVKPNFIA